MVVQGVLEVSAVLRGDGVDRDFVGWRAEDIACPADDKLLVRMRERANARYHGRVAVTWRKRPWRARFAFGFAFDGLCGVCRRNLGHSSRRCGRRTEHANVRWVLVLLEGGGDGEVVADVDDAPRERHARLAVFILEQGNVLADLLDGNVVALARVGL